MTVQGGTATGWDCHVHVFDGSAPVLPGHYSPLHRPLQDIEELASAHGVHHLVLVQPSVYGTDNSVMLRALLAEPGRHRGVAVVDRSITERELDQLHDAGVRGVRFNRVSPAGHAGDPSAELLALAPRLRERGWHVQWYVRAEQLPQVAPLQAQTGLRFVLDHLAGLHAGIAPDAPGWVAARALAEGGAWVKLSGWYRLSAEAPYAELHPAIGRLIDLFGERSVWGSDWPHTGLAPDAVPAYASTMEPVRAALGEPALHAAVQAHGPDLYA